MEFIAVARKINVETLNFLSRLSSRYSRLLAPETYRLASMVLTEAERGNIFYPSDEFRLRERKQCFLNAKGYLSALDAQLSICYDVLMLNPQGAFTDSRGKTIDGGKAMEKIDKISLSLGELINLEMKLLSTRIKSDKIIGSK